jgi:hypothetical protein
MITKSRPKLKIDTFFRRSTIANEYLWLFLLGFVVSLLGMVFTQAEDMGVFITVSSLIGKGYALYTEVFDIKDPLFFYSLAVVQKLFGITGIFVFDSILTALALPLAYAIGLKLKLTKHASFFSSLLFFLTLTGDFGNSLRSQILGIVFFLLLILTLLERRWFSVGVYLTLIFFAKMPMLVVALFAIFPILFYKFRIQFLSKLFLGLGTSAAVIILLLQVRGELAGYIEMVTENFIYASNYQTIVGQREGILGHFAIWNGSELRFVSFLIVLIVILLFRRSITPKYFELFGLCLAINLGTSIYLLATAMWSHHLQIISLYILFDLMTLMAIFESSNSNLVQKGNKFMKALPSAQGRLDIRVCVTFFAMIALISNSGLALPLKSEMPISRYFSNSWSKPVEISMLEEAGKVLPRGGSFARFGMNEDMGFGAFLESNWELKCSRFMMGGTESIHTIKKYLNCIETTPDVVLTAPFYISQKNRSGNYGYYYAQSQRILSDLFVCRPGPFDGYTYCLRRNLVRE